MSILDIIITSRTSSKLLRWACTSSSTMNVRQLSRHVSENPGNVSRQLRKLERVGIINIEKIGQLLYITPIKNETTVAITKLL